MWYPYRIMKLKHTVYLSLLLLLGCTAQNVSPGASFLVGLNGYQNEMESLEHRTDRWADRQRTGESLKKTYLVTIGGSREFNRMVDLDVRRREFLITLRDSSVKPDRVKEKQIETVAAIGLVGMAIDAFSSMTIPAGPNPPSTKVGPYVVSDFGGLLSTVTTPAGQIFRCTTVQIPETGAGIKCEPRGNKF